MAGRATPVKRCDLFSFNFELAFQVAQIDKQVFGRLITLVAIFVSALLTIRSSSAGTSLA